MRVERTRVLAAIAVLGLVSVGCFKISGFRMSKHVVSIGEKTVLELSLHKLDPIDDEDTRKSYTFVALRLPDPGAGASVNTTNPRVFDVEGRFGAPRELVPDAALRDALLNSGGESCSLIMREGAGPPSKLVVLRAEKRTDPENAGYNAEALTRIGLVVRSEEPTPGGSLPFQAIVGAWHDDVNGSGAGVVDEGEYGCTSDTLSWFTVRPDPEATVTSDALFPAEGSRP